MPENAINIVNFILASLGGGVLIVFSLTKVLGKVLTERILKNEQARIDGQLEKLRSELAIKKSTYEHHLDLILDYYSTFYKHYRRCQRTALADAHRKLPGSELKYTKDEFIDSLNEFLADWSEKEGRIRLLLPSNLLEIHEESVSKFNEFKRSVQDFKTEESFPRKKETVFREIDEIKNKLENGLREFLRTENLLMPKSKNFSD